MKIITNIARVIIALVFIISGFLKANDPTGFGFKLQEYFEHFGMQFFVQFAFIISMIVSIIEILIGYALLMGIKPKLTVWSTFVLMLFFWFLVAYSSYTNAVTDCGCFGDAIKFSPAQEFRNDSIFLVLIIIMLIGLKYISPLVNGAVSMVGFIVVLFLSMGFTIRNYLYLPAIDFLPFKEGNSIEEKMKSNDPDVYASKFIYTYLPTGADSLIDEARLKVLYKTGIDSLYKWKETKKPELIHQGVHPPIHDFIIKDEGGNDVTLSFFADDYKLVMTSYDVNKMSKPVLTKISKLSDEWRKTGKEFWGLTNSEAPVTEKLRHDNQLYIDFFNLDATPIKMMVRSNPGLLLIKKDKVIKKWSSFSIPSMDQVSKFIHE
jgi:uncharacterized membrane protein YphA (DoxX/SURF4 family)